MTSKIQGLLTNRNDVIDYKAVIDKFQWLVQKDRDCILSPDSDGMLCGLFMSYYLNWKVRGFYDGKILVIEKGFRPKDCIFLDMEVFRKGIRSIGQHMVMYNKKRIPPNWSEFDDCISMNNIRGYDVVNDFQLKYPFGTIHFLIGVLDRIQRVRIPTAAICSLLYTDGTFKNLFNFPDNCLEWLRFLGANAGTSSLHGVFFNDHYSISTLMVSLDELFEELRVIAGGKRGGDKIAFSNTRGEIINFDLENSCFIASTTQQAEKLLKWLAEKTGWSYRPESWSWKNLEYYVFSKQITKPTLGRYNDMIAQNPISFAITSGKDLQYTLDPHNIF